MRQRVYFPGLDAVRFYAAFCVLYSHLINTADNLTGHGIRRLWPLELFLLTGLDSVRLFFVLSGFLITYLLLVERERSGYIAVPAFYWRRTLRIWPVYFIVIGLTLVILPITGGWSNDSLWTGGLPLFIVMLPNLAIGINPMTLLNTYWSVGVEEQFYLVWPWLVKWCAPRSLWKLFAAALIVRALMIASTPYLSPPLAYFVSSLSFECMILGGVGALLVFQQSRLLRLLYNRYVQVFALALILAVAVVNGADYIPAETYPFITSCFFLVAILNIATNPDSLLKLDRLTLFNRLGRVTYGIYMYHPLVLYVVGRALLGLQTPWYEIAMYGLGIGLSISVAVLSFRYLEQPILRLKDRLFWIDGRVKAGER